VSPILKGITTTVCVTDRENYKYKWNSGFFVAKTTDKNIPQFVLEWEYETRRLYAGRNRPQDKKLIKENGGIDQAALSLVTQNTKEKFSFVPTRILNACQSDWANTDELTKVYHIKSGLRKIVLDPKKEQGELYLKAHVRVQEIARMWWAEENR